MQSSAFAALVQRSENVRKVVWAAFTFSIVLYVGLAYLMFGPPSAAAHWLPPGPFTFSIVIISLVTVAASRWIPDRLLPDRRIRELLAQDPDLEVLARNSRTFKADPGRTSLVTAMSPDEQRLLSLVPAFLVPFIVRLAFNESIVLYGLVLAQFSRSFLTILPFALVALALDLTVSPKLDSSFARAANLGFLPDPLR